MHSALLKWLTKVSYAQLLRSTLFKQLYQIPNFFTTTQMDFRQIVPFGASMAVVVKTYRIELNLVV